MIDLFIPAAPKDYNKVPFVIQSASDHAKDIARVFVCTPERLDISKIGRLPVTCLTDEEVLPGLRRDAFKFRPSWCYQMMLKLLQDATEDVYMVMDADVFFNKPISTYANDGRLNQFFGNDQLHPPYFHFNELLLGIGRAYDFSFLSECTVYYRPFIYEMIGRAGCESVQEFYSKVAAMTTDVIYPAEAELYGNFVHTFHPGYYNYVRLKSALGGRYDGKLWTDDDIRARFAEIAPQEAHIFSAHTWEGKA